MNWNILLLSIILKISTAWDIIPFFPWSSILKWFWSHLMSWPVRMNIPTNLFFFSFFLSGRKGIYRHKTVKITIHDLRMDDQGYLSVIQSRTTLSSVSLSVILIGPRTSQKPNPSNKSRARHLQWTLPCNNYLSSILIPTPKCDNALWTLIWAVSS